MSRDFEVEGFDRLLDSTRQLLNSAQQRIQASAGAPGAEFSTPDGRIVAVVDGQGLLTSLDIAPQAMRLGSQELAEQLLSTINGAQAARQGGTPDQVAPPVGQLAESLDRLQQESVRSMARFYQSIDEVIARLDRRAG